MTYRVEEPWGRAGLPGAQRGETPVFQGPGPAATIAMDRLDPIGPQSVLTMTGLTINNEKRPTTESQVNAFWWVLPLVDGSVGTYGIPPAAGSPSTAGQTSRSAPMARG